MAAMGPDDRVCYCFHVSLRKLVHHARRERPRKASQLSECLGAGTGCGWCIPILRKIHADLEKRIDPQCIFDIDGLPETASDYAEGRRTYLKSDAKHAF